MHLKTRNVNSAFRELVTGIHAGTIPTVTSASRNGEVQYVEEPVTVTYTHPRERVLFNQARDANPFFFAYEALWMLAGRNDVAPSAYYCSRMKEYSDDGKTLNGAYGFRWRQGKGGCPNCDGSLRAEVNQLATLINHLKANPYSRRAVLQMWNVEDDLLKIDSSKDNCCNLSVCFAVGMGGCRRCEGTGLETILCPACHGKPHDQPRYLNMTAFNRSNDLVWGLTGANSVHFSILQEYMAAHLGLEVGVYHQVTNNLHVYADNWKPEEWLKEYDLEHPGPHPSFGDYPYTVFPLVHTPAIFDEELPRFVEAFAGQAGAPQALTNWREPWLQHVAKPMLWAFRCYKDKEWTSAEHWLARVQATDWQIAGQQWLAKRKERSKQRVTGK